MAVIIEALTAPKGYLEIQSSVTGLVAQKRNPRGFYLPDGGSLFLTPNQPLGKDQKVHWQMYPDGTFGFVDNATGQEITPARAETFSEQETRILRQVLTDLNPNGKEDKDLFSD